MQACEICAVEIAEDRAIRVMTRRILSAVSAGYDPTSADAAPSRARRREDLLLLLEMHEPTWTLCSACSSALEAFAADAGGRGPQAPELIRVFGNGFRPKPGQWRLILGAWLDKSHEKGADVPLAGVPLEIAERAHAPFEQFIETVVPAILAETKQAHAGCLIEDWVLRYDDSVEMLLVAVWPAEASQAMSPARPRR